MYKILFFFGFPLIINAQTAFISGNDTICDNEDNASIKVDFSGIAPFTFIYSVNGVNVNAIITQNSPYIINTKQEGLYLLEQFNDATSFGSVSGSGLVTVLESPKSVIHLVSDTLSILYPVANFVSKSIGDIVRWDWNFGDNTVNNFSSTVSHTYDSLGLYEASLIVMDVNGCSDTAINNVYIEDEFWIFIPNSFTPNNEEPNNKFCIEYNGIRENTFIFKVFNSQGDLMFQTDNPSALKCKIGGGWDGKYLQKDMPLPADIYAYEFYFQDFQGWKHQEYGTITLIR
tara:strand:- start:1135 stop:1995 length:861 start_codon:yes stop_codon:yes gene_type:complete